MCIASQRWARFIDPTPCAFSGKGRKIFQPVNSILVDKDGRDPDQPANQREAWNRASVGKRNCSNRLCPCPSHALSNRPARSFSPHSASRRHRLDTTHRATWNRFDIGRVVSQKETLGCDPPPTLAATSRRSGCVIDPPYLPPKLYVSHPQPRLSSTPTPHPTLLSTPLATVASPCTGRRADTPQNRSIHSHIVPTIVRPL